MHAGEHKKRHRTDIHQSGPWYRGLRPFVDLSAGLSYRRTQITGLSNIPEDGAVIFAPNHSNALMDALCVLRTRKAPTVFGARADMFENPVFARILHFLKIIPMVRKRDGIRKVLRNLDIIEDIVEVLDEGVSFCMFPEGTHRTKHSLLPIGKGVFRIAITAARRLGKPVYVVPVGLEYSDYYRFMGTSLLQFGEAIDVSGFLAEHPEDGEAALYRGLTSMLQERISGLFTYLPDDGNYDAAWAYTKFATAGRRRGALTARLAENRRAAAAAAAPGMDEKLRLASELDEAIHKARISVLSFGHPGWKHFIFKVFGLLFWIPLLLVSFVAALPTITVSEGLILKGKVGDAAFYNSVRCVVLCLFMPILFVLWLLLGLLTFRIGVCLSLLLAIVVATLAYPAFHLSLEWLRVWLSDLRLLSRKDLTDAFIRFRNMII